MRNQWRLLLRHCTSRSFPVTLLRHQVSSHRYFSSLVPQNSTFNPPLSSHMSHRHLSTAFSNQSSVLIDIFSKDMDYSEIHKELESNNVVINHDVILTVLDDLKSNHTTAIKFFGWVFERHAERVSSKSYNLMLKILVNNGFVKQFWDMVGTMKGKGYGVSKGTIIEASKKFEENGLQADLDHLKGLFSKEQVVSDPSHRISKIVKKGVWDDDVESELRELCISYDNELVKNVLEKLGSEPMKCLIFFRWIQESGLFKHDDVTYNAMIIALGREDCLDRFWSIVDEMKNTGYEMEKVTFTKVLGRFMKRKMLNDTVSLYEFAMNGMNKPSNEDCTYLLRKIAGAEKLDIHLFSRVVKVFTEKGLALQDSMFDAVLKSLTGAARMKECNKVFQIMLECGYRPSGPMQARVVFDLSSSKMQDEANMFVLKLKESCELVPDNKTWVAFIEGNLVTGDFKKAEEYLKKAIDVEGVTNAGYLLHMLVNAYCHRNNPAEACKVLCNCVNGERLIIKPWHTTYKMLISKLLVQKGFDDALGLIKLMKNDGFPPFLDPFMEYLSRKGNTDEAMKFLKAMTVNKYPSNSVFIQIFEAFSKAGRHKEAQNLLAVCPQYIRNNGVILEIFCTMKSEAPIKPALVAV